jgi:hypothetical protein
MVVSKSSALLVSLGQGVRLGPRARAGSRDSRKGWGRVRRGAGRGRARDASDDAGVEMWEEERYQSVGLQVVIEKTAVILRASLGSQRSGSEFIAARCPLPHHVTVSFLHN